MHFYGFLLVITSFLAFPLSLAYHWVVPEDSLQIHGGQQKSILEGYCSWKKPFRNKAFLSFASAMAVLVLGIYGMCVITLEVAKSSNTSGLNTADVIAGLSATSLVGRVVVAYDLMRTDRIK